MDKNQMPSNDLIVLNKILEQRQKDIAPELPGADFFELFVAEQILKDFDLSYEELKAGIVGGGVMEKLMLYICL